jgi:predicted AAA+ superfamily ATPase
MNLFPKFSRHLYKKSIKSYHLIDRIQNVLKLQTFINKLFKSDFDFISKHNY